MQHRRDGEKNGDRKRCHVSDQDSHFVGDHQQAAEAALQPRHQLARNALASANSVGEERCSNICSPYVSIEGSYYTSCASNHAMLVGPCDPNERWP